MEILNRLGIVALLIGLGTPALAATTYRCDGGPAWVGDSAIRDGVYTGTLTQTCRVQGDGKNGIRDLEADLIKNVGRDAQINQGPVTENYRELPAVYYEVTVTVKDANGSGTIRSAVHIAADGGRLVYATQSQKVALSGLAGSLRKIDLEFEVTALPAPGSFALVIKNTVQVAKPGSAPDFVFKPIANRIAKEQFNGNVRRLLPEIVKSL